MRKPHLMLLLATLVLAATASAIAAAPRKPAAPAAPTAPAAPHEMRVTVTDDDDMGVDDDADLLDDDMLAAGGGPGRKHVIIRRMRGGPGGAGEDCEGMAGCRMHGGRGAKGGCDMPGGMGMGKGPGGPGGGMAGHFAMAMRHLDLSAAQKEKMRDVHEKQMRRDIQARADLQIARLDLHKLMSAEKPDGAAINAQIDRTAKLRSDQAKARVATMLEARALLTPEQQKKAHELMGMGTGPGAMGGPGMGGPGAGMGPMRGMHGMGGKQGMGMHGMGGPERQVRVKVLRDSVGHGPQ